MASDNAIKGQLLSGPFFTAMVGAEVGGTYTSIFLSIDGREEPEGLEFEYDQAVLLHARLRLVLEEIRSRMG